MASETNGMESACARNPSQVIAQQINQGQQLMRELVANYTAALRAMKTPDAPEQPSACADPSVSK
jgi:hypothetical protein